MKILPQSHTILYAPDSACHLMEVAGRTCYQTGHKIGCTLDPVKDKAIFHQFLDEGFDCEDCNPDCQHHSSHDFAGMLLRNGHHAMIEFADIIVKIVTNRGVTHELVRHRHCSFAQESTRYVKYNGDMEFIRPVWSSEELLGKWGPTSLPPGGISKGDIIWMESMLAAESNYKESLKCGWKAQHARELLPNSLKTEIVVKANVREWRHILKLRTDKASHPQMIALMTDLHKDLVAREPVLFANL